MKRNQFISTMARLTILGGMAAFTGILISRDRVTLENCSEHTACRNCGKLSSCGLPEAKAFRKDEA